MTATSASTASPFKEERFDELFRLPEGYVHIQYPATISKDSLIDLEEGIHSALARAKRRMERYVRNNSDNS